MQKIDFEISAAQRAGLKTIRTRIAECGYAILSVAPKFRRNEEDFIAMPHGSPNQLSIIRPTGNNSIVIRPFSQRCVYGEVKKLIRLLRPEVDVPIRFSGPQLPFDRSQQDSWQFLIPKEEREELRLLHRIP